MSGPVDDGLLAALSRLSRRIDRHELRLAPDEWHAVVEAEWRGALVLLERGDVELHCLTGPRRCAEGAVLCFDGVGVRAVHNPGRSPALLVGFSRRLRVVSESSAARQR